MIQLILTFSERKPQWAYKMKSFLFQVFARANYLASSLIKSTAEFLIFVNSELGCLILRRIDKTRFDHAISVTEQQEEMDEFQILSNITGVIDDAVSNGGWEDEHQYNINHFANILFQEYDWEESVIHETIGNMIANANQLMEAADGKN